MPQENRQEFVYRRAFELARSGVHISAITIASALVKDGYPEAETILSGDPVRADLNRVYDGYRAGLGRTSRTTHSGRRAGHRQDVQARHGASKL